MPVIPVLIASGIGSLVFYIAGYKVGKRDAFDNMEATLKAMLGGFEIGAKINDAEK